MIRRAKVLYGILKSYDNNLTLRIWKCLGLWFGAKGVRVSRNSWGWPL